MRVRAPDRDVADRVMAEAWEAGAVGVEEREAGEGILLIVYLTGDAEPALQGALGAFRDEGVEVLEAEPVEPVDWVEAWKQGMVAIEISPRLVVRPSFAAHALREGQRELVIDPGQAFGTGGHASTRLALDWLDALAADPAAAPRRVLDVGTGSGVLAQAALVLGSREAVGFDLDRDTVREAVRWSRHNGVADRIRLFAGPIAALHGGAFDTVVANLLKREMLPIAGPIVDALAPGGRLVLSGLLEEDRDAVLAVFGGLGLRACDERHCLDETGDHWIAPLLERGAA